MTLSLRELRVGYVPISSTLKAPGDRRRFVHYAQSRNLRFEIADPLKEYDLVVLTALSDLSVWIRYHKGKIAYDLIDSYLAIPKTNIKGIFRGLAKFLTRQSHLPLLNHWRAVQAMCERADAVICSTEEQKHVILNYSPNVHIVLDSHSMAVKSIKTDYTAANPIRLVWEGQPQTLGSLNLIHPVLIELGKRYPIEIHLVTDAESHLYLGKFVRVKTLPLAQRALPDIPLQFHAWQEDTLSSVISACDIAVIPLSLEDPFAAGKPENKLLLLWHMGMPVVVSSTPAFSRAMNGADLNLACKDTMQWVTNLEMLITNHNLRSHAGHLGRAYAEEKYGDNNLLAGWDRVFASLGYVV